MTSVAQTDQPGADNFDGRDVESIKIERNSKGVNFSYRVIRHEGQSWADTLRVMDNLHAELTRRFGQ